MTLNKPYNFVGGTLAVATEVNADFDTVYNYINSSLIQGSGSPEGVVTASIGCIYEDTNPSGTGKVYRKSTNSGNTGWVELLNMGGGPDYSGAVTLSDMTMEIENTNTSNKILNISKLDNIVINAWSNSGNLNTARNALAGCGTQNAGLSFGGCYRDWETDRKSVV